MAKAKKDKYQTIEEKLLETVNCLRKIAKGLDQRKAKEVRAVARRLKCISKDIPRSIHISTPGPTDLTLDEENSVDYRYRPVPLPTDVPDIHAVKEKKKKI